MLLPQVGIPIEGISIIIGLYFMVAMVQTMTNITSTVACSYIADRMEKDMHRHWTGYLGLYVGKNNYGFMVRI